MANRKKESNRPIESYEHKDKQRANNPPVGLVTPDTDPDVGKRQTYAYDPHLDPQSVPGSSPGGFWLRSVPKYRVRYEEEYGFAGSVPSSEPV